VSGGIATNQTFCLSVGRKLMKAYRIELVLSESGALSLTGLPFQAGESVEIIVLERSEPPGTANSSQAVSLAGKVLQYDDPFAPAIAPEDWNVLQ
jgi:hypothetical protein